MNLAITPMCDCNNNIEDAEHYLKHCQAYQNIREEVKDEGFDLEMYYIDTLLEGNPEMTDESNKQALEAVSLS